MDIVEKLAVFKEKLYLLTTLNSGTTLTKIKNELFDEYQRVLNENVVLKIKLKEK